MADVTGPISSLPGAKHRVPAGQPCDEHSDRPATRRVQGETDSFGSEMMDMCDECFEAYTKAVAESAAEDACGQCDWCKEGATDLSNRRDFEEGFSGRVYRVCGNCVRAERARIQAELDQYRDDPDYDDY